MIRLYQTLRHSESIFPIDAIRTDDRFYYLRSNETGVEIARPLHTFFGSYWPSEQAALAHIIKDHEEWRDELLTEVKRVEERLKRLTEKAGML